MLKCVKYIAYQRATTEQESFTFYLSPAVSNFFAKASGLISPFTFAHSFPFRKLGSLEEHPMPKSIPLEETRFMPWVDPPLELAGDFCKPAEEDHPVPFRLFLTFTGLTVFPTVCGSNGDIGNCIAVCRITDLWVPSKIAHHDCLVDASCHFSV